MVRRHFVKVTIAGPNPAPGAKSPVGGIVNSFPLQGKEYQCESDTGYYDMGTKW